MPTRNQLIELCQNKLGGGSATADIKKRYRPGIVDLYLAIAFNDLLVKVFNEDKDPNHSNLDSYVKIYSPCVINAADATGKKYIDIPTTSTTKLLQIPNNFAIRDIYTFYTTSRAPVRCLYRPNGADNIYSQLEVNTYLEAPRYELTGEKIYFSSHISNVATVRVHMVVPWSEFDWDEFVPFPLQTEMAIFDGVVNRIREDVKKDKIIDADVNKT
jgi:hypothetical protein